jgi:DNA repair exonuclease SbcCD ATPase subunit
MADYEVNGGMNTIPGNIDHLDMHGGVCYLKGNVGSMTHYGGIVYDKRHSDRVEIRESEMSQQLKRYYQNRIEELETKVTALDFERSMLRRKLDKLKEIDPEQDSDDVLVRRICTLRNELDKEKEAHKKDVDDLNYRIDTILDELNGYRQDYYDANRYAQDLAINDEMFDVLFTFINLYPFTSDRDLAFEFGITKAQVKTIANILKMAKSSEARREAADYLQRQHRELIQRRGGDQGNHYMRPVEKVARNGRVVATYKSVLEAAEMNNLSHNAINNHCSGKVKGYSNAGYKYRYKKQ